VIYAKFVVAIFIVISYRSYAKNKQTNSSFFVLAAILVYNINYFRNA